MVTPDRRRIAVERVQVRFGVSQRRACRVVGSTARPSAERRRLPESHRDVPIDVKCGL